MQTAAPLPAHGLEVAWALDLESRIVYSKFYQKGGLLHIPTSPRTGYLCARRHSSGMLALQRARTCRRVSSSGRWPNPGSYGRKISAAGFCARSISGWNSIGPLFAKGNWAVLKNSTSQPAQTCWICLGPYSRKNRGLKAGEDFYLAYSAERVLPRANFAGEVSLKNCAP